MACPGGCIGGGGMPPSGRNDILARRAAVVYNLDGRMSRRRAHENPSVKKLYETILGTPLGHMSHNLLHTNYSARPVASPSPSEEPAATAATTAAPNAQGVLVIHASVGGTATEAASSLTTALREATPEGDASVALVAASAVDPDTLPKWGTIVVVTCTYGEGERPETLEQLYSRIDPKVRGDSWLRQTRFAVFGLGSTQYACGSQFNAAARMVDERLSQLGASRLLDRAEADDQQQEGYRSTMRKWTPLLVSACFGSEAKLATISQFDPPTPLVVVQQALGGHSAAHVAPPPGFHLAPLILRESLVPPGYDRPAAKFSLSLAGTGVTYKVGDHLAMVPRNDDGTVRRALSLYPSVSGDTWITLAALDKESALVGDPNSSGGGGGGGTAFPATPLQLRQLFQCYMDFCSPPTRELLHHMALCVPSRNVEIRRNLRNLADADDAGWAAFSSVRTTLDVLCEFSSDARLPLSNLVSVVPRIQPRLYSIASAPNPQQQLDLAIVLYQWKNPNGHERYGLCTHHLFHDAVPKETLVSVQVRRGVLKPPSDPAVPLVVIALGTGIAPFRALLQHRQEQRLVSPDQMFGPIHIFFGVRHQSKDFYFEQELRQMLQSGVIQSLRGVFSHDVAPGEKLLFMPDYLRANPAEAWNAISAPKTELYYCGPAMGIPAAIMNAFIDAGTQIVGEPAARATVEAIQVCEDRFHCEMF